MLVYTNFDDDVIFAIIGFFIPCIWLTTKVFDYSYFAKKLANIKDIKGVLVPSFLTVFLPFIFVQIWHSITKYYLFLLTIEERELRVFSSLMPVVAVSIFVAGQFLSIWERNRRKETSDRSLSQLAINNLLYIYRQNGEIDTIENILRELMVYQCHENIFKYKFDLVIRISRMLKTQLNNQNYLITIDSTIHQMNYGLEYIFFLKSLE